MPQPVNVTHAVLHAVSKDMNGNALPAPQGFPPQGMPVQFNPQTLKFTYSVQTQSEQKPPNGSTTQFTAKSTAKLSMELWFDSMLATAANLLTPKQPDGVGDVRDLTGQVAYFVMPTKDQNGSLVLPLVSFTWGNLTFTGVMESMDETVDLFSPNGIALRASVSISITQQDFNTSPTSTVPQSNPAGVQPLQAAIAGANLPQLAASAGISDWKSIAAANNIDNPRLLGTGTLLNMNVSA